MVLGFSYTHTFKYPVDLVTKAYREIHEHQNNVSIKEERSTDEESSMTCIRRTVSTLNPFPKFFQRVKLLKVETVAFFEDIWTQSDENRAWIRSRNLTWEDEISIGSVVYLSPSENNRNWTTWDDMTALDFERCGKFGLLLEFYLKRKLELSKTHNIKMMETVLEKMADGELRI
ncbi:PRELI domain containing 2 [Nesidiocoris tenuis]|uniref:PRELI domain containing 2 n=1 Tax=Nesidiocoris tenuis TaxID=355587 RepID=A0ABN7ANZ3_9HEMI|nr:PRELI domain containing 2 [Nesidiocoris tenuis]